jgi:hypothetical protein
MLKFFCVRFFSLLVGLSINPVALAEEITFFTKSPRLLKVTSTYSEVAVRAAKYYITIDLPDNAGQPLGKVTVHQREGLERIVFRPQDTFAFLGTRQNRGQALTIARVDYEPENKNTISIIFDPPVPAGNTVTLGLKPEQNPNYEGIYLLRITAYPLGEQARGLYLGVGRLHFYRGGFHY